MSQGQFRSRDDVHQYVRELSARRAEDDRWVKVWQVARRLTWIALLAASFLIYYLISTVNEAVSLPQLEISTPLKAPNSNPPPPAGR